EPGQRFAQQPRAATDIEHAQALETGQAARIAVELAAGGVADIAEPQRVDLVQRGHLALRIPPLLGELREAGDLRRVDGRGGARGGVGGSGHERGRAVMALRKASGRAMVFMVSRPSPTPSTETLP